MADTMGSDEVTIDAIRQILGTMRQGPGEIVFEGVPLALGKKLGEGSSKSVYEAFIAGNIFALALPNPQLTPEAFQNSWSIVLKEPVNTKRLRELGLMVNPVCNAISVTLNTYPFTLIQMGRYQDLPYEIMDAKNPASSTVTGEVLPKNMDISVFQTFFSSILPDVETLLRAGVQLDTSSVSICIDRTEPRLFLSDLGTAIFSEYTPENRNNAAKWYIQKAINAFKNGLTGYEAEKYQSFFLSDEVISQNPGSVVDLLSQKIV